MTLSECLKYASLYLKSNDNYYDDVDFNDYCELENKNDYIIKCYKCHELIFCNGAVKKPYFRHKSAKEFNECTISKWHLEWQSNFDENDREIEFIKKNGQIKTRRADINLKNTNFIVELQHSYITKDEVRARKHDYNLHNKAILWIIDGNKRIDVKKTDNRYYLEFTGLNWKTESFKEDYEDKAIFIDINEKIYVVFPNLIKNNMIDIIKPYDKIEFIHFLKNDIQKISETIPYQCNLYIKQQGAGNGKTYGIIQSIDKNDDFLLYNSYIIVSKQHSAKSIIYNELEKQFKEGLLKNMDNIQILMMSGNYMSINDKIIMEKNEENEENENNKKKDIINDRQIIVKYNNKYTNKDCKIIICTIDSFLYRLGDVNNKCANKFEGIIKSIIDNYRNLDTIKYNDLYLKLNKETCLIIDETQDLNENYGKAIMNIMVNSYIDAYIVGDKLQSISYENNAFVYLNKESFDYKYIKRYKYQDTNICRRFINKKLVSFINNKVPFDNYDLIPITPYKEDNNDNDNVCIFERPSLFSLIDSSNKEVQINTEIQIIINYMKKEIEDYNRKPEDFLFITPFATKNWFCEALERAIQLLWTNIYMNDDYKQYVVFHKSENGTCINLNDSKYKTRIVTIHTSKGDGRKVVFIIGMTENGLLKFCDGINKNLIYYSLIHVALTRQEEKLYIRLENNKDHIYDLFHEGNDDDLMDPTKIKSTINMKINKDTYFKDTYFKDIYETFILASKYDDFNIINEKNKRIVDTYHHNIRYACMFIEFIMKFKNEDKKKQIFSILKKIQAVDINYCENWKEYNNNLKENKNIKEKDIENWKKGVSMHDNQLRKIPILKLKSKNNKYYDIICDNVRNIIKKIKNDDLINLCPIERIILLYMIDIIDYPYYIDITITELYNIINIFNNCFSYNIDGHDNCICKTNIDNNQIDDNPNKDHIFLKDFYHEMNHLNKIFENFLLTYNNLYTLINQSIYLKTKNNDYSIKKRLKALSFNDNYIFNIYIKPQFNELNYYEILFESIIDTYFIQNSSDVINKKLFDELANKKIKTIIFSLEINDYFEIEWDINDLNKNIIVNILKDFIVLKYKQETKNFYKSFKNDDDFYNKINNDSKKSMPIFVSKFFAILSNYKDDNDERINNETFFNDKLYKLIEKDVNAMI